MRYTSKSCQRQACYFGSRFKFFWSVVMLILFAGCSTPAYYFQAIRGQSQILADQKPILQLIGSKDISPELEEKFILVLELREFAAKNLALPAGKHYLKYADLNRRYVVWNVYAAPEFSLQPKTWWYPLIGNVSYRGYFSEANARRLAEQLKKKGFDVYVSGIEAYSTLGWFTDPLLNTFTHHKEQDLAAIIFHELTHHRLYVPGDTDFNEALATAVAEEGLQRWLKHRETPEAAEKYLRGLRRRIQFIDLVMDTRRKLQELYSHHGLTTSDQISQLRQQKEEIIASMADRYRELKKEWNGYTGYDDWFKGPLNNAQLSTVSTYYRLVPAFRKLLQHCNGDLEQFFHEVEEMAKLSMEQRHAKLQSLLPD